MKLKTLLRTAALTAATLLLWTGVGWGQINISATNTAYSENFDALTSGSWTNGSTVDGWYARTDATPSITAYGANTGSTTTAGLYAFGIAGTNPLSDRALGFAPSNTYTGASGVGKGYIGWRLKNNTGQSITSIEVKWTGEQWRKENNAAAHSLVLTYQVGATVADLTSGTWVTTSSSFTSPIIGATTAAALDGNASANRLVNITFLIEVNIPNGEEIMLRWEDLNDSGNDHLMAIDDVSVQAFAAAGDTQAPVATFSPANGATDVAVTVNPTISFNEAIRNIDDSEITNANVASLLTFKDAALADVPFTATINAAKTLITVTPSASLSNETAYTLGIAPVEDAANNATTQQSATFTTIAAATPTLNLTSSHTGLTYYAKDVVTVTWTSSNLNLVDVEAYVPHVGGWLVMSDDVPAALGTATFTIPADAPYGTTYKVRVKNAEAATPVSESGTLKVRAVAMDLATVRGYALNDEFRFDGVAIVTFSRPAGVTGRNQKYMQDATAGILVDDATTVIATPYAIGDAMSGLIARRSVFNNLVQIVPLADPGAPVSTGNPVVPEVKTLSTITSADQGKLVRVYGVNFASTGNFAAGQNYTITDASKGTMIFRTLFAEANYIGQPIPQRPLDLVLLVGQFNADLQVSARNLNDIQEHPQLTVVAGPNGTVSNSSGYYPAGTQVTVTATPNAGYLFHNWTDGSSVVVSTDNPYTFSMPATDLTLTANFREFSGGTVSPNVVNYYLNWDNGLSVHTITWNDASSVTGITYFDNDLMDWVVLPPAIWSVTNNNGTTADLIIYLSQIGGKAALSAKGDHIYSTTPARVHFNAGPHFNLTANNIVKTFVRVFEVVDQNWQPIAGSSVQVEPYFNNENPGVVWNIINPTTFELAARRDYMITASAPGFETYMVSLENVMNDGTMTLVLTPVTATSYIVSFSVDGGVGGNVYAMVGGFGIWSGASIPAGSDVTFSASPWWGYKIKAWKVNGVVVDGYTGFDYTVFNLQSDINVTVEFEEFNFPQINPDFQFFSMSQPADVEFEVIWGSETEITDIECSYYNDNDEMVIVQLVEGVDYTVAGNTLTISSDFILNNNQGVATAMEFRANFGLGSEALFTIVVVYSTTPLLMPSEVSYDLTNPGDVFTNILYAMAESITSVSVGGVELVDGQDYHIDGTFLFVHNSYLSPLLTQVDDQVIIDVEFDTQDVATLTITAIETGIINATINPTSMTYYSLPEYQDITITWNDATAVTGLNVKVNFGFGFEEFEWPFYEVTDNGDGTANLRILFEEVKKAAAKETTEIIYVVVSILFDVGAPAYFFMTIVETRYDVIVNINPANAGWVIGDWDYREGAEVGLYAFANSHYRFVNWTNEQGVVLSTENPYKFTMPANDVVINANFEWVQYVSFYVYDQSNWDYITNAVITINGVQYEPGNYFFGLPAGSYTYFVEYTGFVTVFGTFTVTDEDITISVPMVTGTNPTYTVTFAVVDGSSNPITDAVVTLNGVAGLPGQYVISNVAPGVYSYSVAKAGYFTATGSVTVTNANVNQTVTLQLNTSVNPCTFANFSAYPNPFSNSISLSNPAVVNRVVITNIIGQRVMDVATNGAGSVETASLPAGIYLVTFEAASGERLVRKMIKK